MKPMAQLRLYWGEALRVILDGEDPRVAQILALVATGEPLRPRPTPPHPAEGREGRFAVPRNDSEFFGMLESYLSVRRRQG